LEIFLSGVLIAFGIVVIFFLGERDLGDAKSLFIMVLGALCIIAGLWIFVANVGMWTIIQKMIGIILVVMGIFLIVKFPGVEGYQPHQMSITGIFIGIIILIIGIYLLFF